MESTVDDKSLKGPWIIQEHISKKGTWNRFVELRGDKMEKES